MLTFEKIRYVTEALILTTRQQKHTQHGEQSQTDMRRYRRAGRAGVGPHRAEEQRIQQRQ